MVKSNNRTNIDEKTPLKKGAWNSEEDRKLINYIKKYKIWNWSEMSKAAGLARSGKSCRLRWVNYLRPDIKHGNFSHEEVQTIMTLHETLGNRWASIASKLPGRTDNEVKNYWHTHLKKRLNNNKNNAVKATKSSEAKKEALILSDEIASIKIISDSKEDEQEEKSSDKPMSSTSEFTTKVSSEIRCDQDQNNVIIDHIGDNHILDTFLHQQQLEVDYWQNDLYSLWTYDQYFYDYEDICNDWVDYPIF